MKRAIFKKFIKENYSTFIFSTTVFAFICYIFNTNILIISPLYLIFSGVLYWNLYQDFKLLEKYKEKIEDTNKFLELEVYKSKK